MDVLLGKLTSHAMNYAIKSGISITTGYAINQCAHLLQQTPRHHQHRQELRDLQHRLESKVRILCPAIDMIELIAARGNTTLENAVVLTRAIRQDIQRLGSRIGQAIHAKSSTSSDSSELLCVISLIKSVLMRIEDAIPLINLAITTSGINLTTKLSGSISPSRLLQASTFLTAADANYTAHIQNGTSIRQQVGPTWTLSLYMLFAGHASRAVDEGRIRHTTWKEVIHKARVKLVRVPLEELYDLAGQQRTRQSAEGFMHAEGRASEFAYQLVIIEDLDDDRVHTYDDGEDIPATCEDVVNAGIGDVVPIHEISRIFYADTGKMLNIGTDDDVNSPVLLIKRDVHAVPPRRMLGRSQSSVNGSGAEEGEQSEIGSSVHLGSAQSTPVKNASSHEPSRLRLPADLDPEWMALEVYVEGVADSDGEDSAKASMPSPRQHREDSLGPDLVAALSRFHFQTPSPGQSKKDTASQTRTSRIPPTKTSLSLLEMLIKLTALQQFRQDSHLAIEDELLNFFLEDSATAGAGADKEYRRRLRSDAVKRVGFDPYDESPVKRRGQEYIAHPRATAEPGRGFGGYGQAPELTLDKPPLLSFASVHPTIERTNMTGCSPSPSHDSPAPLRKDATGRETPSTPRSAKMRKPTLATPSSDETEHALTPGMSSPPRLELHNGEDDQGNE